MLEHDDETGGPLSDARLDQMVQRARMLGPRRARWEETVQAALWSCAVAALLTSLSVSFAWIERARLADVAATAVLVVGGGP